MRTSTPPSRARNGFTWPGRVKSADSVVGSLNKRIVVARSLALTPVPIPWRGCPSTLTVNAVLRALLRDAARSSSSRSQITPSRATHKYPPPMRVKKFTISGVIFSAATTKSPSFSRCSSSTRTMARPADSSFRISSIEASGMA